MMDPDVWLMNKMENELIAFPAEYEHKHNVALDTSLHSLGVSALGGPFDY